MTIPADLQTAIIFYGEMESKVNYFGLDILVDRDQRLLYKKGKNAWAAVLPAKSSRR